MRCRSVVVAIAVMVRISIPTMAQDANQGVKPELITFKSGGLTLKGFIWKPEGSGPFPAILWNYGAKSGRGPSTRSHRISLVGVTFFLCPTAEVRGGRPAPISWIS